MKLPNRAAIIAFYKFLGIHSCSCTQIKKKKKNSWRVPYVFFLTVIYQVLAATFYGVAIIRTHLISPEIPYFSWPNVQLLIHGLFLSSANSNAILYTPKVFFLTLKNIKNSVRLQLKPVHSQIRRMLVRFQFIPAHFRVKSSNQNLFNP